MLHPPLLVTYHKLCTNDFNAGLFLTNIRGSSDVPNDTAMANTYAIIRLKDGYYVASSSSSWTLFENAITRTKIKWCWQYFLKQRLSFEVLRKPKLEGIAPTKNHFHKALAFRQRPILVNRKHENAVENSSTSHIASTTVEAFLLR